jgi:HSP20 family protein
MSRWDKPLGDLISLQERMNRLFEESLQRGRAGDEDVRRTTWTPPVDILETEQEIVLRAEVPGIAREDIGIDLDQSRLTIRGERRFPGEAERERYHRIERSYGPFARSFELPPSVDQEKIAAEYKDGVLTIRMAKRQETRSKQIEIAVG